MAGAKRPRDKKGRAGRGQSNKLRRSFWFALADRAREVWRRRLIRRLVVISGALAGTFLVVAWLITYTDIYKQIPSSVWKSGELKNVALVSALLSPRQRQKLDSIRAANSRAATSAPPIVEKAAAAWVKAVNENSPGAILTAEADSFGNIYLVLGSWWDEASDDHRVLALDALGATWRAYLSQQFPTVGKGNFKPGVLIVDDRGRLAQNIDGRVELLRR